MTEPLANKLRILVAAFIAGYAACSVPAHFGPAWVNLTLMGLFGSLAVHAQVKL